MKGRGEKKRSEYFYFISKSSGWEKLPNEFNWLLGWLINPENLIAILGEIFCVQCPVRVEVIVPTCFRKENKFFISKKFSQFLMEIFSMLRILITYVKQEKKLY